MRHLLIVARDHPELVEQFQERFKSNTHLEIVVDRRRTTTGSSRTEGERRAGVDDVDAKLWVNGYVLVRTSDE